MKTRLLVGLLVGGLMAAVLPGVAAAAAKEGVIITSPMTINFPDPNTGRFTTTGTTLCSTGDVYDNVLRLDGWDPDRGRPPKHVYVEKTFTCDDASGTFDIRLHAIPKEDGDTTEKLRWTVLGGTGDYAGLMGQGGGFTVPDDGDPYDVVNIYDGTVWLKE